MLLAHLAENGPGKALITKYRMLKASEEIEALQTAATYSDTVYAAIAAEVKPGIS